MKYIKEFEIYDPNLKDPDNAYFQRLLIKFLNRIKTDDFTISTNFYERDNDKPAIALNSVDARKGYRYKEDKPVLTIRVLNVSDKQLRKEKTKPKFKILLKTFYDTTGITDQNFLNILIEFLNETFTKYSYWNIKRGSFYEYFINTSNVDNIENEFDNLDIELYKNMKKYNI